MTQDKLDKMCCPFDKNDLQLKVFNHIEEEVIEGIFTCAHCERYFPIIAGIPIMVPDEFREYSFEEGFLNRWQHELPKILPDFRVKSLSLEE